MSRTRRPGLPLENSLVFYTRYAGELLVKHARLLGRIWELYWFRRELKQDPAARSYPDLALTPMAGGEFDSYELFPANESAKAVVAKARGGLQTIGDLKSHAN